MLIYWFVGWLALVFLFLSETIASSLTGKTPGMEILIIGILIFLPPFRALVTEIMKDFSYRSVFPKDKSVWFYIIMGMIVIFMYKFGVQLSSVVMTVFLVSTIVLRIDGRISFLVALTCLAFCPLLLMVGYAAEAETLAIYAYYFLVIGVVAEVCLSLFSNKNRIDAINI